MTSWVGGREWGVDLVGGWAGGRAGARLREWCLAMLRHPHTAPPTRHPPTHTHTHPPTHAPTPTGIHTHRPRPRGLSSTYLTSTTPTLRGGATTSWTTPPSPTYLITTVGWGGRGVGGLLFGARRGRRGRAWVQPSSPHKPSRRAPPPPSAVFRHHPQATTGLARLRTCYPLPPSHTHPPLCLTPPTPPPLQATTGLERLRTC